MTRLSVRRPGRRATRQGIVVSALGALALAAGLVWQDAYAAFTDTTAALPASAGTGTVAVSNNVEGLYAVTLPQMRPGDSDTECIVVTSTGSVPAEVRLYGRARSTTASLSSYLTFDWTAGTGGGANGACTGFVSDGTTASTTMANFPITFGTGLLPWKTAGGAAAETKTYRLTYSLAANPPAGNKGATASITFVWEAQNR
jgi:hypothetical protein